MNFVPAQSKMSIYVSRKNEVGDGVVLQLTRMIRTRIIEFNYDREMKDLEGSSRTWTCGGVLSSSMKNN